MTSKEVDQVAASLLELGRSLNHQMEVLEWGAGGSTVYFSDLLRGHGISFRWVSMEYNRLWHERVSAAVGPGVEVVLFDVGNTRREQRDLPMDEYVAYPRTLNRKFDFILVDGRKRRRCLLEAWELVAPQGRVLLHDAQRRYYHCAMAGFTGLFLGRRLWEGRV